MPEYIVCRLPGSAGLEHLEFIARTAVAHGCSRSPTVRCMLARSTSIRIYTTSSMRMAVGGTRCSYSTLRRIRAPRCALHGALGAPTNAASPMRALATTLTLFSGSYVAAFRDALLSSTQDHQLQLVANYSLLLLLACTETFKSNASLASGLSSLLGAARFDM